MEVGVQLGSPRRIFGGSDDKLFLDLREPVQVSRCHKRARPLRSRPLQSQSHELNLTQVIGAQYRNMDGCSGTHLQCAFAHQLEDGFANRRDASPELRGQILDAQSFARREFAIHQGRTDAPVNTGRQVFAGEL
ncbi:hypothetical protein D3C87_1795660 [compost metagenome]